MKPKKLLQRLRSGALHNVAFDDFTTLVEALGFELDHVTGSHRIYRHPRTGQRLNVQSAGGSAKAYQLRDLLAEIDRYNLSL